MIIRSKAPLRLGLAGGGTDVSPYSDVYGGAILNATISLYAFATLIPRQDKKAVFNSIDKNISESVDIADTGREGELVLLKGIASYIRMKYGDFETGFELSTFVDAPAGSGLGTSSTLCVAIISAFAEWMNLPLGEYDIAKMAYDIERSYLGMAGGKQDQYAATFGGFNFMEFAGEKVIVNPLRVKPRFVHELENNLLLYYTSTSRLSSTIIEEQQKNVNAKKEKSVDAMHKLKEQSVMMKEAILTGKLDIIGEILDFGWNYKKQMAEGISNPLIDELYASALKAGASGGKISGAGGGGFMIFYCPQNTRYNVMKALKPFGGEFKRYQFVETGVVSWRI
jgi:D-glycero-alpha-D-manno-heptose-7-phosphate kinase